MKRIIVAFLLILNIGIAYGASDRTITSKTYVDNQLATKQDKIRAIDDKTVITHTGTSGEIGEKGIYDSTNNYAEQQTSLVTAGDANTGINNALENEFICIDADTDGTCLIWEIKPAMSSQLPNGYTALEYLESTGRQYINTGVQLTADTQDITVISNVEFMAIASNYGVNSRIFYGSYPNAGVQVYTNGSSLYNQTNSLPIVLNTRYNVKTTTTATRRDLSLNGTVRNSHFERSITDDAMLYLFGNDDYSNHDAGGKLKLYLFKVYKNGVLVRNLVPALRNSDSKPGMYDLVSGAFFTNIGADEFVIGTYLPSGN